MDKSDKIFASIMVIVITSFTILFVWFAVTASAVFQRDRDLCEFHKMKFHNGNNLNFCIDLNGQMFWPEGLNNVK